MPLLHFSRVYPERVVPLRPDNLHNNAEERGVYI